MRNSARCDNWFPWQQIGLQREKRRHHIFSNIFDRIHFILAGNDDIYTWKKVKEHPLFQINFHMDLNNGKAVDKTRNIISSL